MIIYNVLTNKISVYSNRDLKLEIKQVTVASFRQTARMIPASRYRSYVVDKNLKK